MLFAEDEKKLVTLISMCLPAEEYSMIRKNLNRHSFGTSDLVMMIF